VSHTLAEGGSISGIALFKDQLYISRGHSDIIEVYHLSTLSFQRNLHVAGLGCVNAMTSCPDCNVLFIADICNNLIHVVDEHGLAVNWKVDDEPRRLSVNSELNVLVTFYEPSKLREFTPSGQLVREITLQSDINYPRQAIQLDNNRYAVTQGYHKHAGLHRVCIVNSIGTLMQSYGGDIGSGDGHLNTPGCMALSGGSLIVSDFQNQRLLVLNSSSLTTARTMMYFNDEKKSIRMTLSEDGSRLYSAHNLWNVDKFTNGHVKVIDISWE